MGRRKHIPPELILASASPRRRELLRRLVRRFRILPSGIPEDDHGGGSPASRVRKLALKKALHVRARLRGKGGGGQAWVLGADTLVFLGNRVVGKPSGPGGARRILRYLSGTWHRVYTGVAFVSVQSRRRWAGHSCSWVKMRRLSAKEIDRAARRHLDKAGAYAVQEKGDPFVERIRGDYENVVGLPLGLTAEMLRRAGFRPTGSAVPARRP